VHDVVALGKLEGAKIDDTAGRKLIRRGEESHRRIGGGGSGEGGTSGFVGPCESAGKDGMARELAHEVAKVLESHLQYRIDKPGQQR
jgi:hypothetical protein